MTTAHHICTGRTARYFTLGSLDESTREIWIVLHGYAQLAKDFITSFTPLDDGLHFIVAPEALNRFYARGFGGKPAATWMTSEDREHEISDYIAYLDAVYHSLEPGRFKATVVVCGFSQGVTTASRWIHATSCHIDHFILYAGEIAHELQAPLSQKISGLPLTYITGNDDRMLTPEKRDRVNALMDRLNAARITFNGGHEVNEEVIASLLNITFAQ